jgi:membrane protein
MLAWLYACWAIVLLGAEIAFAHQNLSHYRREAKGLAQGPAEREATGLRLAVEIARAFSEGGPPARAEALSERLGTSVRGVRALLEGFERAGIVVVCGGDEDEDGYVPARPLERIPVSAVLAAMRGPRAPLERSSQDASGAEDRVAVERRVDSVLADLDRATASVADALTLADLLDDATPA